MDNLWTRRTNTGKLSLTTSNNGHGSAADRNGAPKRYGESKSAATTPGGANLVSPGASSAFGLGSGAFASFGSAKTPKTPGNPFDRAMGADMKSSQAAGTKPVGKMPAMAAISETKTSGQPTTHALRDSWAFWYRPPISKAHGYIEYENTLHGIANVRTAEEFWSVYTHLKRPSTLPVVSDYHLFKKDVRPIWEDEVNRKGGKLVVRLKKGVADRLWEDLLLALIGDQFAEVTDEICGAVLSVRHGEDILSIWYRNDGGRVIKIRDIMKHALNFPANTKIEFKSHDSSIAQRTAIDEQRREKATQQQNEKRNVAKQTSE